jgi:hypothetical protein
VTDLEAVRAAATRFRRALESASGLGSVSFEAFPHGSCGDAATLLGQYLEDCGLGTWSYMSGWAAEGASVDGSHGWVERDGVIVDITADQFDGVDQGVIVTRDRSWHNQFVPMTGSSHPANLAATTGPATAQLRRDYGVLRMAADA